MKSALQLSVLIFVFGSTLIAQTTGDYRSIASGPWSTLTTWERYNGTAWVAPATAPTSTDGVITIQSGHTVQITSAVIMDQVIINSGGTLNWTTSTCTIAAGTGVDLQVDGMFWDNRGATTPSIVFNATATWQMGANGTLRRSAGNSSNNWQNAYEGGIVNIPSTSNWVLQKNTAQNPSITTIGAYYGNLIIENNAAGTWLTPAASTFQGAGGFPTIKGNLDIGGTGSSTVNFINQHTNASPTLVKGNVTIRTGNIFQNNGTGLEIQGNLTVNGTISYGAANGRNLNFTGASNQTIQVGGSGTLGIYNFAINKSANTLTLNSPITVNNVATFINGIINSSSVNLFILNTAATVTGASNNSFVNGPVRRLGGTGITFPVGKVASYRPIGIGNSPSGGGIFWTENFGTASCSARGTLANGFNSGNGAWTQTDGANGSNANQWYVSPTEANMGLGGCGDGCASTASLTNSTLHISAIGALCGTPDCGAAYDATDATNITDRRVESPVINCSGQSGITLSFLYIGNGEGLNDNCIVWYNDGTTWSILSDPATSALCGALCGFGICQGQWTSYSIALPASANNNPNVRIGFQWVNDGNNAGSDPSFAVDDITLSTVNNSIFTAEYFPSNPQIPYGNLLAPTLTNLSDCEYWILDRNAGTDSRTVTLSWNSVTCYNSAFASFEVARYDGISTWQDHDGIISGTASGGTVTTPALVTSFSPFAIAYVPLPLPIELASFTAECKDHTVQVNWSTASEQNNSHFIIEKSPDMISWEEVYRANGSGTSNTLQSYHWTDLHPTGMAYYRLKQVDFDGKYKIYDPAVVNCFSLAASVNIYPNPAAEIIYISTTGDVTIQSAELFSLQGQFLRSLSIPKLTGTSIMETDVSVISPGTYYLRLSVNGEYITKRIVIVR